MDLRSKIEEWKKHYQEVTLTDLLGWYKKLLRRLPDISHLKNIVLFGALGTLIIFIMFAQRFSLLYDYLPKQALRGGSFEEGVVGKIEGLNPLFSPTSSAEQAATSLLFSGLTKEDGRRKPAPDLAEKWDISGDGRTYSFLLKENLVWHDGKKLTADDVVFTIETIQNPDVKSPLQKIWEGVTVSAKGEREVIFSLKNSYPAFLSETDVPIVPKHLLEEIPGRNIRVSEFSTKPIGSGPYEFVEFKEGSQTQTVIMKSFKDYYGKKPYIENFYVKSYPTQQRLLEAFARKEVKGIERVPLDERRKKLSGINYYQLIIPTYDALYFNLRTGIGKDKAFREAVSLAVNREEISKKAYDGEATAVYTPLLPGFLGHNPKLKAEENVSKAKEKLAKAGYVFEGKELKKDGNRVSVRLITTDDAAKRAEAKVVSDALSSLGIEVKSEYKKVADLVQNNIRPRDFDLLLISQNLGGDSDIYPYWHSTQANDPGTNFSGFSNRLVDKYLEQARQSQDESFKKARYQAISEQIFAETPAVFLVSPSYFYGVSREVKGLENQKISEPKNRFWNVAEWYIRDKRGN